MNQAAGGDAFAMSPANHVYAAVAARTVFAADGERIRRQFLEDYEHFVAQLHQWPRRHVIAVLTDIMEAERGREIRFRVYNALRVVKAAETEEGLALLREGLDDSHQGVRHTAVMALQDANRDAAADVSHELQERLADPADPLQEQRAGLLHTIAALDAPIEPETVEAAEAIYLDEDGGGDAWSQAAYLLLRAGALEEALAALRQAGDPRQLRAAAGACMLLASHWLTPGPEPWQGGTGIDAERAPALRALRRFLLEVFDRTPADARAPDLVYAARLLFVAPVWGPEGEVHEDNDLNAALIAHLGDWIAPPEAPASTPPSEAQRQAVELLLHFEPDGAVRDQQAAHEAMQQGQGAAEPEAFWARAETLRELY